MKNSTNQQKSQPLISRLRSFMLVLFLPVACTASTGNRANEATGEEIRVTATDAQSPALDYDGNPMTVVYLENLGFEKIGKNSNDEDVAWLLSQGYRVIELDYAHHAKAIAPTINKDIIAINDSIAAGSFCGYSDCSHYRSYVLFEGYRLARDVPYFVDDPTVYNTPAEYTVGDSLYMDLVYPANPSVAVPVILSFSYSNSYATWDSDKKMLTAANQNQRLKLDYTLAGFNDSFLEGAPANGIAWAIADHPKYCSWGKGKPKDGPNDAYKSYETNPDAAQKVKSAIRTLRVWGDQLGLSGKIGIFGFSRGSTAGSMAIGDRTVPQFENAGFNIGTSDDVQAAALGPGVFDYTLIYDASDDGDKNMEARCPWVWGPLADNYQHWKTMGSEYLVETSATAPVLFFYNTDDEIYYQDQVAHLKAKLDSLGVPTSSLIDYGTGHAIPQTEASLTALYAFFKQHLVPPALSNRKED
ncbi:alpha/beta hydrolase family protein [Mangrovibacterium lignilyticum]|uniref:alpha/beta hydrolase family protein n=1 Tax=Mangrovibacterium lignilyticum TaxID=2668052 RepID=UPI0013D00C4F|nr:hypothetical protein [Mangrovibacterium lignilyticum]